MPAPGGGISKCPPCVSRSTVRRKLDVLAYVILLLHATHNAPASCVVAGAVAWATFWLLVGAAFTSESRLLISSVSAHDGTTVDLLIVVSVVFVAYRRIQHLRFSPLNGGYYTHCIAIEGEDALREHSGSS
jgi:F0F1-type ATP synthase assembly protein I